jgi:hypothetical protein
MSLICSTACGDVTVQKSYYDCTDEFVRGFGASHFILLDCAEEFTDILDPTEWAAKITANTVHISPPGILTVGAPTSDVYQRNGCGRESLGRLTYQVDFQTYEAEADLGDWRYWNFLFRRAHQLKIILLDCEGNFYMDNNWAAAILIGSAPLTIAGESPGYDFSVTVAPHIAEGEADKAQWVTQFQIKTPDLMGMALLPGVAAAF